LLEKPGSVAIYAFSKLAAPPSIRENCNREWFSRSALHHFAMCKQPSPRTIDAIRRPFFAREPLGAHPALVATFLGHLRDGGASAQTLGSRAAAIRFFHRAAGLASPTDQRVVRDLLEGARREDAGRDHGRATVTAKRLAAALELQGPPATPIAIRDRAIVLLTFASGRRRAEIAGLNVEDLDFGRPGFLILTIRKSKTDQGGAGAVRGHPAARARTLRGGGGRSVACHPRAEEGAPVHRVLAAR
jgi:integrase